MKCGFKQVFVADAGTWEQNLNSPIDHSDGSEAGGAALRDRRGKTDGRRLATTTRAGGEAQGASTLTPTPR